MSARTTLKFPHDPILVRLLIAAQQTSDSETIVHDALGFKKSYPELLTDILQTRDLLRARLPLPATNEQGILRGEFQYVAILSRSGYEFLVAFFAIRAMGGVCMPLGERLHKTCVEQRTNHLQAPASFPKRHTTFSQRQKRTVCSLARTALRGLKISAPISKSKGTLIPSHCCPFRAMQSP